MTTNDTVGADTLHIGSDFDDWEPLILAVDGYLWMIGDRHNAEHLRDLLNAYLDNGTVDPEPISQYDPQWHYSKPISWAVEHAREYAPEWADGRTDHQIGRTIRAAAERGSLQGARQDDTGAWWFYGPTFRGWLIRRRDETRGRPRKK